MKHRLQYFVKWFILRVCYGKHFPKRCLDLYVGNIIGNWFFQKILRVNSHIKFPLHYTSQINKNGELKIHDSVKGILASAPGVYIEKMNGLEIGEGTLIAPGVKIISSSHDFNDFTDTKESPIRIGKHCWLSANVVILPNVNLGDNTIVAAGAVVNKSFDGNCIIGGVPAKIIKQLNK
ncbi:N/A [soil metagenome]